MVSTKRNWKSATKQIHAVLLKTLSDMAQPNCSMTTASCTKSSNEVVKIVQILIGYVTKLAVEKLICLLSHTKVMAKSLAALTKEKNRSRNPTMAAAK